MGPQTKKPPSRAVGSKANLAQAFLALALVLALAASFLRLMRAILRFFLIALLCCLPIRVFTLRPQFGCLLNYDD
jgi:hypothetical protein